MPMLDENVKKLPGAPAMLALCFGVALFDALCIIGEAVFLSSAISELWNGSTLDVQAHKIALFFAFLTARHVAAYVRESKTDAYARTTCASLRMRALDSLYDAGTPAIAERGTGSTVSTLVEGLKQVRRYIAIIVPKVADLMVLPLVLSCALIALDPISGVICLVMLPAIMFYMRLLGSHARQQAARQLGTYQQLANHFTDSLRGIATLKAFGAGKRFANSVYERSEQLRTATAHVLRTATLSSLILDLFRVFALAAVAILLGFRLMSGDVELMNALTALIIVPELFAAVRRYSTDFHASLDGRNQLQALLQIIEQRPFESEVSIPRTSSPPSLSVHGVSFSYSAANAIRPEDAARRNDSAGTLPSASSERSAGAADSPKTPLALSELDFDVTGPARVGIVGVSGSGKSTLANLLAGFSNPKTGSFTVDGRDVASLNCGDWRSRTIYLPQNPHLFNASLRENIAFYQPGASDEDIVRACQLAGLQSTLAELEAGLDTVIGEGGRGLSGGQAQRVALARAFLDNTRDVLVFDEPTAHLDIETELDVKKSMLALMDGKIAFFATHRLHWLNDMDLIIVLDHGKIAEMGTLDQLLASNGALCALADEMNGGVAI